MWAPVRVATFGSSFTILLVVAFADGGFFHDTWVWITLALSSVAWIALALRDEIVLGRLDVVCLAALASFAGWVALSAAWSPTPEESLREGQRTLMYVAAFLAFLLVVDRDRIREHLAGIAAAAAVVAAFSLADRLVRGQPPGGDPVQGTLLFEPLGYANALAILVVIGLLVSLGLAVTAAPRAERAAWLATSIVFVPALAWTESRAAWLALLIGLCVLLVLAHRAVAAAAAVAIMSGLGLAILWGGLGLGPRVDYWRVAWNQWQENAWLGSGAGTFAAYWQQEPTASAVLDAHSLYLETLAELGPIGLALLLVALAIPILAAVSAHTNRLAWVAASGYAAYLVHAGIDWDWEMPAVTLAGLLCAVAALAAYRPAGDEFMVGVRGRRAIALAALVIAGLAVAAPLAL